MFKEYFLAGFRLVILTAVAALGFSASARAETADVRIAQLYGLTYLPAYIVYEKELIQKHAVRLGLPAPKVTPQKLTSGPVANDALISGNVDIAMGGITVLMTLWDRTQGPGKPNIKGFGTMCESPIYLLTADPKIKSLKDFGENDRIAVSAVKVTMQAIFLQMAAAKEFGWENRGRFDPMTVSMSHPESVGALKSGKLEVKSYAAILPFNLEVLTAPHVRQLTTSYELLGSKHSLVAFWGAEKWVKDNPKTYEAVMAAFEEAEAFIAANPAEAARVFIKWENSTTPAAEVVRILGSEKDIVFTMTPNRTMDFADVMHKVGLVKLKPQAWTDMFFEGLHKRKGS
jgi:NitT/TauT family transport system substrate-binding protein